jgi:hypothetical protein
MSVRLTCNAMQCKPRGARCACLRARAHGSHASRGPPHVRTDTLTASCDYSSVSAGAFDRRIAVADTDTDRGQCHVPDHCRLGPTWQWALSLIRCCGWEDRHELLVPPVGEQSRLEQGRAPLLSTSSGSAAVHLLKS